MTLLKANDLNQKSFNSEPREAVQENRQSNAELK